MKTIAVVVSSWEEGVWGQAEPLSQRQSMDDLRREIRTMSAEAVSTHTSSKTGVVVEVWRAEDWLGSRCDAEGRSWVTCCVDHSESCYHRTEADALEAARDPIIACRTCFWLEDLARGRRNRSRL